MFTPGDSVRLVSGPYSGTVGKVYSRNALATGPYPYGVKFQYKGATLYRAFSEDELKPEIPQDKATDNINNPSHYTWLPNGLEVIDLAEHLGFNRGNAVKYLARAGRKNPATELEDLKKAAWYLKREIARIETENEK